MLSRLCRRLTQRRYRIQFVSQHRGNRTIQTSTMRCQQERVVKENKIKAKDSEYESWRPFFDRLRETQTEQERKLAFEQFQREKKEEEEKRQKEEQRLARRWLYGLGLVTLTGTMISKYWEYRSNVDRLEVAVKKGDYYGVHALVPHCLSATTTFSDGISASKWAAACGHRDVYWVLRCNGAPFLLKPNEESDLEIAARNGNSRFVDLVVRQEGVRMNDFLMKDNVLNESDKAMIKQGEEYQLPLVNQLQLWMMRCYKCFQYKDQARILTG